MTWSPFNQSQPNNPMLLWGQMTWRQRVSAATFHGIIWGVIFPAILVGVLVVMGMMMEGVAERSEQLDRCKRQAATPQEYHQCR